MNNALDFKENDEHAIGFALNLSRLFCLSLDFSIGRLVALSPSVRKREGEREKISPVYSEVDPSFKCVILSLFG
jgi:hypothetical protein